jgi:prepilin-type N-terminal cleavage/methylation domain-containing protein
VSSSRSGFTLVEVLVAVTILSVGVVALAGTAGTVTRMVGRGKIDTRAAQLATLKLDSLRVRAYSAVPRCTGLVNGGPDAINNISLSWTVAMAATGSGRDVTVSTTYATARGTHTEALTTYIEC